MDSTGRTALVIALVVVALLLLLFGGAMATGTMMSGAMMGSGSMGGFSWMWLPTLLVVVLGAVLFSVISGKWQGTQLNQLRYGDAGRCGRIAWYVPQSLTTRSRHRQSIESIQP